MKKVGLITLIYAFEDSLSPYQSMISVHPSFCQEPWFIYLTGLLQRGAALLLDPYTNTTFLFLPNHDEHKVFWEGEYLGYGLEALQQYTGDTIVYPVTQLPQILEEKLKNQRKMAMFWHYKKQHHYSDSAQKVKKFLKKTMPHITLQNCDTLIWPYRLILDDQDYHILKITHEKTASAFHHTLEKLSECKTENELAGFLEYQLKKQSHFGTAFPTICASGKHACTLHYNQNQGPLQPLLLLDFGLRYESKVSDISRTLPISGKFNPLEEILYHIVLETQETIEKEVKPGRLLADLNQLAWYTLNTLIEKKLNKIGGKWKKSYDKNPHQIGHAIGICVHEGDPNRQYYNMPLQPGMLISNEPGLYGYFELEIAGQRYRQWIGIRIEDNLWLTKQGCENLSKAIPK